MLKRERVGKISIFRQIYSIKMKKKINLVMWIIKAKSSSSNILLQQIMLQGFFSFSFYSAKVDLTFI